MSYSLRTDAVHGGRADLADLGVHALPLDLSTTYPLQSLGEATHSLDEMAHGGRPQGNSVYARLHNPTVDRFEVALARLERAPEAVAFSSGMAAMTACLLAAREHGNHVVGIRPLYGGTDHLLNSGLLGHNIEMSGYCTACSLDIFFSHRAEQGHTGRFGLFAGLRA